jgi:hypothetical protein
MNMDERKKGRGTKRASKSEKGSIIFEIRTVIYNNAIYM